MQIVLSGALPEPPYASKLLPELEKVAPTLVHWLNKSQSTLQVLDSNQERCTALEYWQLQQAGFQPKPAQHSSAGLGVLWMQSQQNLILPLQEAIWLGELVHIAPSRDGAALIPSAQLDISAAESEALFTSSVEWFEGTGFTAEYWGPNYWRITPPADFEARTVSSDLVSQSAVNNWWEQDTATRPWRKLVNELQMFWFNHPVNQQRSADGKLPINSLWLQGGGSLEQFSPTPTDTYQVITDLADSLQQQDWSRWLEAWQELEKNHFAPLQQQPSTIVLCGLNRLLTLSPRPTGLLQKLFAPKQSDWKKKWSSQ